MRPLCRLADGSRWRTCLAACGHWLRHPDTQFQRQGTWTGRKLSSVHLSVSLIRASLEGLGTPFSGTPGSSRRNGVAVITRNNLLNCASPSPSHGVGFEALHVSCDLISE